MYYRCIMLLICAMTYWVSAWTLRKILVYFRSLNRHGSTC